MRAPSLVFYLSLFVFAHIFGIKLAMLAVFLLAWAVAFAWRYARRIPVFQEAPPAGSAVFLTGTSSGIGFSLSLELAQRGLVVFAGVRKIADGERLVKEAASNGIRGSIVPVICDVASRQSVSDASVTVKKELEKRSIRGLYGVFSNAGVMLFSPVETMDDTKMSRWSMEVNYFGTINVVQFFVPLLREFTTANPSCTAHLGLISSVGGFFSSAGGCPYAATKHAVEALGDALRGELRHFRIHTTLYEFGAIVSSLGEASESARFDPNSLYYGLEKGYQKMVIDFRKSAAPTSSAVNEIVTNTFSRFSGARVAYGLPQNLLPTYLLAYLPDTIRDMAVGATLKW